MTPEPAGDARTDFEKAVAALNARRVEYAIIGGYAVVYYGHVRNTQDMDILIRPTTENARRAVAALRDLGFSQPEITPEVFTHDNGVTIGVEPVQIDMIAYLPGVDQEALWSRRERGRLGGEAAYFISLEDLLANKREVGRNRDLDDVKMLEAARARAKKKGRDA